MNRIITDHEVNAANSQIGIYADEPTHGNASHVYTISFPDKPAVEIAFQNGPVAEDGNGVNGVTQEVLLTIVADRLRGFQSSPYACDENGEALYFVESALSVLHQRTLKRQKRGVEGTHKV